MIRPSQRQRGANAKPGVRWHDTVSHRAIYRIIVDSEYAEHNRIEEEGKVVWYAESVSRPSERDIQMEAIRNRNRITVEIRTNRRGHSFETDSSMGVYRHTGRARTSIGSSGGRRVRVFELERL
nr:hypothetical protein TetV2_00486 [Oceanusvirus sp.]